MPRIKEHMISIPLLIGPPPPAVRFPSSDAGAGASVGTAVGTCALASGAGVTAGGAVA
jgi:hypothetical protein